MSVRAFGNLQSALGSNCCMNFDVPKKRNEIAEVDMVIGKGERAA